MLALLLAPLFALPIVTLPASMKGEVHVVAETLDLDTGPHCGVMHVISTARVRVIEGEGVAPGTELTVVISCAEMSFRPARIADLRIAPRSPWGRPDEPWSKRLLVEGEPRWFLVQQTPRWHAGHGHLLGKTPPAVVRPGVEARFEGGVAVSISAKAPTWAHGRRGAAAWMGFPERKGMSPVKRDGAWVWPADDEARRLAPGVEGQLKDGAFTVRRVE